MSRIRADRYTNREGTGAPTFSEGVNVVGVTSMSGDLAVTNGTITGPSQLTISGITSSISDTAVDVFVYDTSKDSDGGAWRKRTQNTSWYNETLGTATRGSRKEFPAVAVIVVESLKVTIYDGDDPDLPMWMVFNGGVGSTSADTTFLGTINIPISSILMLNGVLCVGFSSSGGWGVSEIRFVSDSQRWFWTAGISKQPANSIAERNVGSVFVAVDTSASVQLVSAVVNDVAMTVLPNAPIDSATGLPVPTIAVATDGGVSVIKDDGTVYDLTTSDIYDNYSKVEFGDNNRLYYTGNSTQVLYSRAIPTADQNYTAYNTTNTNRVMFPSMDHGGFLSNHPVKLLGTNGNTPYVIAKNKASGSKETSYAPSGFGIRPGLTFIDEGETNPTSSVAYATTSYNTGWMHGDIKGAFLSDTDATNATATSGASNIIQNGDFGTGDLTNWTSAGDTTPSISAGGALLTSAVSVDGTIHQVISNTPYGALIEWTVTSNSANNFGLLINGTSASSTGSEVTTFTASGSYDFTGPLTGVGFRHRVSGNGVIDNIVVRPYTEADRSVISKGLMTYGTITKTPVATGAELVAYSGFSASNLFVQPYNSNLNPGTGDYSFTLWFKCSSTGGEQIYMRRFGVPTVTGGTMMRLVSSSSVLQWYVRDTSSTATAVNSTAALDDGNWHCAVGTREGATAKLYIDGRLDATSGCSANSHDPGTTSSLVIGAEEITAAAGTYQNPADLSSMALIRYSLSAPSAEQVKKMYHDEKFLFQENAKCTLYGSSDAVTALAYDEVTDQLHVGTSSGRSDFQGLRRINNTTTAVTTAISAHDEFIIEQ